MGVHAGGQAVSHVFVEGVGGHGDDGHRRGVGPVHGPDGSGRFQTVHDRHADVHEDGVEVVEHRFAKGGRADLPVVGGLHDHFLFFEHGFRNFLVQRMVFAEEDVFAGQFGNAVRGGCVLLQVREFARFRRGDAVEFKFDGEDAAFAYAALHGDRAAHELHELFRDGQPQARAFAVGGVDAAFLRERFEERFLECFAHADAVVSDFRVHRHAALLRDAGHGDEGDVSAFRRVFD